MTGREFLAIAASVSSPPKFVLFVGDIEEGPPATILRSVKGGARALGKSSKDGFPALCYSASTQHSKVPTAVTLVDELPADFAEDDDAVVVPLHLNESGDLILLQSVWQPLSTIPQAHRWFENPPVEYELPPVMVPDLAAGSYEVQVVGTGRNTHNERISISVCPHERPRNQVLQAGSEFGRFMTTSMFATPAGADEVWVDGWRRAYLSGRAGSALPRWFGQRGSDQASQRAFDEQTFHLGRDSVSGSDPDRQEFLTIKAASRNTTVPISFEQLASAPDSLDELEPLTDAKITSLESKDGTFTLLDGNREPIRAFNLPRPGWYGVRLMVSGRDFATQMNRYGRGTPEHWTVQVWPTDGPLPERSWEKTFFAHMVNPDLEPLENGQLRSG